MNGLQLAICDLALPPEGAAPNWVHLLPTGKMEGRDGRSYTLSDPQGLIAAFQASGIDLPVDYEHQSDKPEARINGPVPAAGWIKELRADDTGLWGRVEWTATAAQMIGRKEYRFLSPSFLFDPQTREVKRLKGAGLVHKPNLFLTALASQDDAMPDKTDFAAFLAAIAGALGVSTQTPPDELLRLLVARIGAEPDPAKYMPVSAVQSMLENRREERLALSSRQAQDKVERAFRDGFLTTAMKPWALALCQSDEGAFDEFLAKSGPVFAELLKPAIASAYPPARDTAADHVSELERAICGQLGLKPGSLSD